MKKIITKVQANNKTIVRKTRSIDKVRRAHSGDDARLREATHEVSDHDGLSSQRDRNFSAV